jgi:hypothetical protein
MQRCKVAKDAALQSLHRQENFAVYGASPSFPRQKSKITASSLTLPVFNPLKE